MIDFLSKAEDIACKKYVPWIRLEVDPNRNLIWTAKNKVC